MDREETLGFAEELLRWGIPVIVCSPRPGTEQMVPVQKWHNITNANQCDLSSYKHGRDALALIGGHGIDILDVDTKSEGSIAPFGTLRHYGITRTPSGGLHYVITSTGLRMMLGLTVAGQFVGDYVGGNPEHEGRLIAYLPGSYRPNKYGDVQYRMEEPWDIEGAVVGEVDERVREILVAAGVKAESTEVYYDDSPERDPADGVHPKAAEWIDEHLQRFRDLPPVWSDGDNWDGTTFEVACSLLRLANSGWTGYSVEQAEADLLEWAPTNDVWGRSKVKEKWSNALKQVGEAGHAPPREPRTALDDFDVLPPDPTLPRRRPGLDVTNQAVALDVIFRLVGQRETPLAGLFRRGPDLVYTPRVGEAGYIKPSGLSDDGPMQIQRMGATALCAYINRRYNVHKVVKQQPVDAMLPKEIAYQAVAAPALLESLRVLQAVTHTPVVRVDGSVLRDPGFDEESGILYLPDRGLHVPERHRGVGLILDDLLVNFPFQTIHDRTNYIGALLTPLLRAIVPPPFPLFAIGASQPGAGKTLLALVLRIIHGGVFRAEMVREEAEFRKQITSILDTTSAPVVTFDNVTGTLKSSTLDGLLTNPEWSDRILGITEDRTIPNDRLWTITGNNLTVGGDLQRRTIWVTIEPGMEHPEQRTGFKHDDLPGWVSENRGELLAVLLGMVEGWVADGRPVEPLERTDSFAKWQQTVGGILRHAGVPGVLNHKESIQEAGLDSDGWGDLLAAIERVWGDRPWQVRDIMRACDDPDLDFEPDSLPDDVVAKMRGFADQNLAASKVLGAWCQARRNRWYDGRMVVPAGADRKGTRIWKVVLAE